MVKDITCDVFDCEPDVIIHQANCQNTMGTGIAKTLKDKWPEVYEADCYAKQKNQNKLGNISIADINDNNTSVLNVLNCYSQFYYGRDKRYTDYEAFSKCLEKVREFCETANIKVIAAPNRMGCMNASGDWRIIRPMFDVTFENCKFDVLICKI